MTSFSYEHFLQYSAVLFSSLFCSLFAIFFIAFPHWGTFIEFIRLVIIATVICSPAVFAIGFLALYLSIKTTHKFRTAHLILTRLILFAILALLCGIFVRTNMDLVLGSFEIDFIWPIILLLILFIGLFDWTSYRLTLLRKKKFSKSSPYLTNKKA